MMWFGGMFLGWVLWLALIAGGIWLVAYVLISSRRPSRASDDPPMETLREGFARGEISREEYEQRRKTLLSS